MASNTSLLDTNLNTSPYFDDYDPTKQYYKVLFKPGTAVQVRELNQLQSILQNQITSFGQNIFKEGSVIKGCTFTFDNNYNYVKLNDTYANGTALTVSDLVGYSVTNPNGLTATVINSLPGLYSNNPDLNTLYIKYLNTGTYGNGAPQTQFANSELLTFTSSANLVVATVVSANVADVSGKGYAFTTTEGIIFKKGYFIYVDPQTAVIDKYSNQPDGISVGFSATEELITASNDTSLYDNAAGAPNYSAPGADRLKLIPTLVTQPTNSTNTTTFFSLVDFKQGAPVTIRQDTQFNSIAIQEAQRSYETNGNFVVNPFIISTQSLANTSDPDYATHYNALVSTGIGYVNGYRVQFNNSNAFKARRGTDYANVSQQNVSLNFGYYVILDELSGEFGDSNKIIEVQLHSVPKTSITNRTFLGTSFSPTTQIGTAYVRGFSYNTGSPGTSTAQYRLYLFDISMNPGSNFNNVQSIIYYDSGVLRGVGDIVLDYNISSNSYIASIKSSYLNCMIFPFGQNALSSNGFNNTEFDYRKLSNTNFSSSATNSIATVGITTPPSGSDSFLYLGTLSPSEMNDFIVIPTSNGYSTKTGTVTVSSSSNVVSGSGTSFLTDYAVGDFILTNTSDVRNITSISNNVYLTVDSNFSSNAVSLTHQKAFITGNPIPFSTRSNRSMNISANTLTISLGEGANAAFNIQVASSIARSGATPIQKIINRNIFVKIDCSNNINSNIGPWGLGIPDVLSIDGVYIDTSGNKTYTNTSVNYANNFNLDNGQRDAYYNLATLNLVTNSPADRINTNTTILVQLSAFTHQSGSGYFTCNSYPVDDVNTSNVNAITTAEIPTYSSSGGRYFDLRNCIDFRPVSSNTANVSTSIATATINPPSVLNFIGTPILPDPDSIFITDLAYYLGRTDRLAIDTSGNIVITEGLPAVSNPPAPSEQNGTMTLSLLSVPPYPSLTTNEAKEFNRYDLAIQSATSQNRRYTMKDIKSLDTRITNLEYYTSLSLLEQSAASLQIKTTSTGQTRFQNGIFVDPFTGFDLSNTLDPQYYMAIDPMTNTLRPAFVQMRSDFAFDSSLSSGVQQHGELIMLPHTSNNVYITQQYASKYRNCIEGNIYTWRGTITLTPSGSTSPDTTTSPNVVNNLDLAQNWLNLQNAWGTQWGNWQTLSTTSSNTFISGSSTVSQIIGDGDGQQQQQDSGDGQQQQQDSGDGRGNDG
jgi:Domain of unknown function (DUF4815)